MVPELVEGKITESAVPIRQLGRMRNGSPEVTLRTPLKNNARTADILFHNIIVTEYVVLVKSSNRSIAARNPTFRIHNLPELVLSGAKDGRRRH